MGYVDTLEASGLPIMPYFAKLEIDGTSPLNYQMLKYVINTLYNDGYTAIMCENDEVAFCVHMCCESLSIRVPEDISITGFDNIEWAVTGSAQITTVDQNFEQIGKEIAQLITSEIYVPRQRNVPVKLVLRTSTGPAAR
jgi:DNA-binding LacI/PurR family transcriptional regulator